MDLKITHYNFIFKIKGQLDKNNVHLFYNEFQNIFEKTNSIIINIEELRSIDRIGVNAIAKLHNEAISKHKQLSIIGLGCDDLMEHFRTAGAA